MFWIIVVIPIQMAHVASTLIITKHSAKVMIYKCDIIHKSNPHSYYGKPIHNLISIILQCWNTRIVIYAHHKLIISRFRNGIM